MPRVSAGVMGTTRRSDPTLAGAPEAVIPSPVRGIGIKRRWGCEWVRDPVSESPRKLARIYSGQSLDLYFHSIFFKVWVQFVCFSE